MSHPAESADFVLGSDRFRIVRRIGAGGMGVVYEAIDAKLGARVALKTLPFVDADGLLRLKHEFRVAADLHHEHLVRLGELHEAAGRWFFTMELVAGVDFLSYVRPGATPVVSVTEEEPTAAASTQTTGGALDEARLRASLGQLLEALAALHGAGLVHRDLKPSNVLVTAEGRLVLLDLGLVTDRAQSTQGRVVGTVAYMAPEQAASQPVGPPADLYAVGSMLFEALTGRVPFEGAALAVLVDKQRREPPASRSLAPGAPADLDALCAALLARDPALRPRLDDVRRAVRGGASAPAATASSPGSSRASAAELFVGRAPELVRLEAAYNRIRSGESVALAVEGESGIGKSALARRFLDGLRGRTPEPIVLAGRCYERESVPFKAWDGVVDALSRAAERLTESEAGALRTRHAVPLLAVFPVLRRVRPLAAAAAATPAAPLDPQERRRRVFLGLRELLGRLAEIRPVVVCIDDLQWADADSLPLLAEVLRPPDPPALLLLATQRPEGAGASPIADRIVLCGLAPEEAEELARRVLRGAPEAEQVRRIARSAGGHPLFIDELARFAKAHEGEPLDLDQALRDRREGLDAEARRLLALLALAGVPLALGEASRAAELDGEAFARALSALRAARLVRGSHSFGKEAIEPYHDRVREAIASSIPAAEAIAHHRALALALEAAEAGDANAVGTHWMEAGEPSRASPWILRAAEEAERTLAFSKAVGLYQKAVTLARDEDRTALRLRFAEALASAGRCVEAGAEFEALADVLPAEDRDRAVRRAAHQYLMAYDSERGFAMTRRLLKSLGMQIPVSPLLALLWSLFLSAWMRTKRVLRPRRRLIQATPSTSRRARLVDACAELQVPLIMVEPLHAWLLTLRGSLQAERLREPARLLPFCAANAGYAAVQGRHHLFKSYQSEVQLLVALLATDHARSWLTFVLTSRFWSGCFREAVPLLDAAQTVYLGDPQRWVFMVGAGEWCASVSVLQLGMLQDFVRRVHEGRAAGVDTGNRHRDWSASTFLNGIAWLIRDELDAGEHLAQATLQKWKGGLPRFHEYCGLFALSQRRLYASTNGDALEHLNTWWRVQARTFMYQMCPLHAIWGHDFRGRCLLAAHMQDGTPKYVSAAGADARRVRRRPLPPAVPTSDLLAGGVALASGDREGAKRALQAAGDGFGAQGLRLQQEVARWRLGELTGGAEGQAMVAATESYFRNEGVKRPERLVALFAPVPGDWRPRK